MRSKRWWVLGLILLAPRTVDAAFLYTLEWTQTSEGPLSFAILRQTLSETPFGGNWPAGAPADGSFIPISIPPDCQISVLVEPHFDLFSGKFLNNEAEVLGFCFNPMRLYGVGGIFEERFDHVGTYVGVSGSPTLTIAEVPEPATWLLSGLGLALLRLKRARR
ncbi:MAG: PEP-CTERM sorting domain-containing protein [Vicinamibacterales bacterium]